MFDSNLILVDGSATWSKANIVDSGYGIPTSTIKNNGGFRVIDLGKTGATGISVVAIFPTAAGGTDELNLTIEASSEENFATPGKIRELLTFGGKEAIRVLHGDVDTPAVYVGRITTNLRYVRAKAVVTAGDDFKLAKVLLTPYAFNVL